MHKLCKEYLEKRQLQAAIRLEGERNAFLLREGLYEKEYAADGSQQGYPHEEWDPQLRKMRHFRKIPIPVTDQEWEALQSAYASSQGSANAADITICKPIARLLKATAYGLYAAAFLIGCFLLPGGYIPALLSWGIGFPVGTLFLGIAEIIRLLNHLENG